MRKRKLILFPVMGFSIVSCSSADNHSMQKTRMLYEALAEYNKQQAVNDDNTVRNIHQALAQNRTQSKFDLQIIEKADFIHQQTELILSALLKVRTELRAGGRKADDDASSTMLGQEQGGLAYSLLKRIKLYSEVIQRVDSTQKKLILLPITPITYNDAELAEFYFSQTSVQGAFASLSQIESRILEYEKEALLKQSMKIGCGGNIRYSTIGAFAAPETNVVAAGSIYQADLLFVKILQPVPLIMEANGKIIPVRNPGIGRVSFKVGDQGLNQKDSVLRNWTGLVKTKIDERDTVFKIRVNYIVVRPNQKH